jgi:hypothetical protein
MSDNLQEAITKLRLTHYIKSNQTFDGYLSDINKFATTEEQKAFLLGCLFKNKNISNVLPKDVEEIILHTIKNENLHDYFYNNSKPEFENFELIAIVFLIVGVAAILGGTIQILTGYFSVGLSERYMVTKVHEGGTVIIFGLISFIGGLMRFSFERKKETFITSLLSKEK